MIAHLVGNKSIEKVFFFLLLNGKCYATQLAQCFDSSLTPIQQALQKLEKEGIITSYCEGKTRLYEFNTAYPLYPELEALLKKAYIYLNPIEKKQYYSPQFQYHPSGKQRLGGPDTATGKKTLLACWEKLTRIQTVTFSAKSKSSSPTAWNGLGKGTVQVTQESECVLRFQERGSWVSEDQQQIEFSNAFRWTLNPFQGSLGLEHLRFGINNPVFLLELVPAGINILESADAHVCQADSYFARIRCDQHYLQLNWRAIGPKKNEEMDYLYT